MQPTPGVFLALAAPAHDSIIGTASRDAFDFYETSNVRRVFGRVIGVDTRSGTPRAAPYESLLVTSRARRRMARSDRPSRREQHRQRGEPRALTLGSWFGGRRRIRTGARGRVGRPPRSAGEMTGECSRWEAKWPKATL
jgi:hypothetical protein